MDYRRWISRKKNDWLKLKIEDLESQRETKNDSSFTDEEKSKVEITTILND